MGKHTDVSGNEVAKHSQAQIQVHFENGIITWFDYARDTTYQEGTGTKPGSGVTGATAYYNPTANTYTVYNGITTAKDIGPIPDRKYVPQADLEKAARAKINGAPEENPANGAPGQQLSPYAKQNWENLTQRLQETNPGAQKKDPTKTKAGEHLSPQAKHLDEASQEAAADVADAEFRLDRDAIKRKLNTVDAGSDEAKELKKELKDSGILGHRHALQKKLQQAKAEVEELALYQSKQNKVEGGAIDFMLGEINDAQAHASFPKIVRTGTDKEGKPISNTTSPDILKHLVMRSAELVEAQGNLPNLQQSHGVLMDVKPLTTLPRTKTHEDKYTGKQ